MRGRGAPELACACTDRGGERFGIDAMPPPRALGGGIAGLLCRGCVVQQGVVEIEEDDHRGSMTPVRAATARRGETARFATQCGRYVGRLRRDAVIRISRAVRVVLVACGTALLTACGEAPPPDPAAILAHASTAANQVSSLHFRLHIEGGGIDLMAGVRATEIEGDVVRPDRLDAKVVAQLRRLTLRLEFRSIGADQWITNPLAPGQWQQLPGAAIAGDLLDPHAGVTTLATAMTDVTLAGAETIDDIEVHHLSGRMPNEKVAAFLGAAPVPGETAVEFWIGIEDSLVRRVELRGPTAEGDSAEVVRALEFSAFDKPVTIEPPG